jgi:hypothetical protein
MPPQERVVVVRGRPPWGGEDLAVRLEARRRVGDPHHHELGALRSARRAPAIGSPIKVGAGLYRERLAWLGGDG